MLDVGLSTSTQDKDMGTERGTIVSPIGNSCSSTSQGDGDEEMSTLAGFTRKHIVRGGAR